ncbi:atos homolog protein A isoform X2 [Anolis carolinensis]|uniref:Atos homolog protein A n=2 Tax=Anolis carolinensis TaxID=28377 RepID=H9GUN2_ANOCA|nr:PREDICTED: protein FAM214A [Anolis carolinensis]|eukprot:XP_008118745.1 PREDICTED: protein FAM214A [Anolis carolinensis]
MKPDRDTLDEYFEYEAEEFLVNLALLITEGRTPEYSVKGRTEGLHCPPAQSSQPTRTKHECSDKLGQCRQARRTRSEVTLLWKNNIPIMIEVMLLPDCCYSDEGPTTEGSDLNDPAIKQDALLLERWILEPVPRQSGDRFIEEKTLLLAVRSFVFFSQLSAWLSVSHGAVPRNILYRISAAHVDLQWTFSQTPTEHFFPVPNVSHNVALKVSVQSLPRQSNYPVLTCSIHTNLGFYEKRIEEHNERQHCDPIKAEQGTVPNAQRACSKLMRTESGLGVKKGPEFSTAVRNLKFYPSTGLLSDFGASEPKVQCFTAAADNRKLQQEPSERASKPLCLADSYVPNGYTTRQSLGESIPLIGSLLQERHEVIARIAQHLIHCDPATSPVMGRPFGTHETGMVNPKVLRSAQEEENPVKKGRETSSVSATVAADLTSFENGSIRKAQTIPETPLPSSYIPMNHCSRQTVEETNPLISSLLQERQEVIARIAQHLIHCDPSMSHTVHPVFHVQEMSSVNPKAFHRPCEEEKPLKKGKEASLEMSRCTLTEDNQKTKGKMPATLCSSLRSDDELNVSPNSQIRRKLMLAEPSEVVQNAFQQPPTNRNKSPLTSLNQLSNKEEYKSELADKLESVLSGYLQKSQVAKKAIAKQYSHFNGSAEQICTSKCKNRTNTSQNSNLNCLNNPQLHQSNTLENMKVTVMQASDSLHRSEHKCFNKGSKQQHTIEQNSQLASIENCLHKDLEGFKCKTKQDRVKNTNDENEDPTDYEVQKCSLKKPAEDCLVALFEQKKNAEVSRTVSLKHMWHKNSIHHLDGTSTKAFHPRTGLPLLSSPVPERKTRSGCFDLDTSLLHLKCFSKSPQHCLSKERDPDVHEKPFLSSSAPPVTSLSLLGNFEESVLNYRLDPLGIVDGFTAEVGASGVFCPTHMTLPVEVSFYSVSDDNAPSPYMGVIALESLGKRGYRVPPSGTIQVTLFNPNKTVVKMFVVIYDLREMPANHQTFLRQRTFSVPVKRETKRSINKENTRHVEERLLRYLIHLRFQSSKSGKIYLYRDVRLLFSRKSMEVDSGAAYELKSYTESPTNPQFSPRC